MKKWQWVALSALLAAGCEESSDAQEQQGPAGGKADCAGGDRCPDGGGLVPICEDGEDVGCLRHGITADDWDATKPEFINPGWDEETRQRWNHQDQGTKILPLSWILALEPLSVVTDRGSLIADAQLKQYGLIPDHDTRSNPYQLPVGFTVMGDFDLEGGVEDTEFGYTCAACHTQAMRMQDAEGEIRNYQIAGGSGLQDFGDWNKDLVLALVETKTLPLRRGRFVERVQAFQEQIYGESLTEDQIGEALDRFSIGGFLLEKKEVSDEWEQTPHGPGRLDALGRGFTTLHYDYLKDFVGKDGFTEEDLESNLGWIDGMVSFPPIYDGPKFDWAEYGHSIRQSFARNTSEAVAVNSKTNLETLEGDVNPEGLFYIEQQLRLLQSPTYPGEVDEELRQQGQSLFWGEETADTPNAKDVHCARCHGPREAYDGREWKLNTLALGTIGTDPKTLVNFASREVTLPQPVWETMFSSRVTGAVRAILGLELDPQRPQRVLAGVALFGLVDALGIDLFDKAGWDWRDSIEPCRDPATWDDGGTCEATQGRLPLYRVDIPKEGERADEDRGPLDPMLFLPPGGIDWEDPRCDDLPDGVQPETAEAQAWIESCLQDIGWLAYRARPLNGMWNAAPYLHNNSVPNMCALLGDPQERPDSFYVGNIDFDDECLGFPYEKDGALGWGLIGGIPKMPDGETNSERFEADLPGNGNRGHEFSDDYDPEIGPADGVIGRALTDDEIRAIIEYVKSLPPLPSGPDGDSYVEDYVDNRYDELR